MRLKLLLLLLMVVMMAQQFQLLFGIGFLHIAQIGTAAGPGTAGTATVRIVVDAVVVAAGAAGMHFRYLEDTFGAIDDGWLQCVQTSVAPVQVTDDFFHHGAVHLAAGVDLFQLPLQRFHLRLQDHSFHIGIGRSSSTAG